MSREATVKRKTLETDINLYLNLDGSGKCSIETGIGFFDHMLTALAVHAGIDLEVKVKGDLNVDCHHTIEDTGIVLGNAFAQALGDKKGIVRYGEANIPMDEALAFCALDISGREYLVFNGVFDGYKVGDFETQMTKEFFRAFAYNAGITMHIDIKYGENDHHKIEAAFKAVAHALNKALKINSDKTLSTKGVI